MLVHTTTVRGLWVFKLLGYISLFYHISMQGTSQLHMFQWYHRSDLAQFVFILKQQQHSWHSLPKNYIFGKRVLQMDTLCMMYDFSCLFGEFGCLNERVIYGDVLKDSHVRDCSWKFITDLLATCRHAIKRAVHVCKQTSPKPDVTIVTLVGTV